MAGEGCATPEGTSRYAARHGLSGAFRPLGPTDLLVSPLGFGGYRVHVDVPAHRASLRAALDGGCNLIDTSTNYTDGGSEALVGAVLRDALDGGALRRDEVVVVSKVGYMQGQNLAQARRKEADGAPYPEVVRYADDCWHCLHPDFVRDQLARTRERLGLARVDLYLLHNPEYFFLDAAARDDESLVELRETFYDRLRRAFEALEALVAEGELSAFGLSSNTLAKPEDDPSAVSLPAVLRAAADAARAVGGIAARSAFAAIQLPYNVVEREAADLPPPSAEGESLPLLQAAARAGLAVLVNRPLNAISADRLIRLASRPLHPGRDHDADVERAVLRFLRAERHLIDTASGHVPVSRQRFSASGRWMADHWHALTSHEQLAMTLERKLVARTKDVFRQALAMWPQGDRAAFDRLAGDLWAALRGFAVAAGARISAQDAAALAPWERELERALPAVWHDESVARKALLFCAQSSAAVTCVLNGMRSPAYVDDALAVLRLLAGAQTGEESA